ncbi:HMG domain-containing protein 4 [Eurytemora carolleeae]|uniref:HMG domain-containing protein 4 n=1 Tax=Eurytemora carolleeae TaxID=1294199 RepID=UPI000C7891F1|nr:HMG domain-containing protein 4 [Eurytemora carolleeae]|eukprot:XP_023330322.1 HMG domain-containing protein 4-like [Eurytemora affinis]
MSTPDDTNISRSGRIRKKSSKLADFQSPDEISEGTKQRRSSKKDGLSGSIFDPPEDSDSETDFGIDDLEMEIDQFDVKLEDLDDIPDLEDDDFSDSSSRTEIVKKPLNLPMVEDKRGGSSPRISPFLLWAKHTKPELVRQNPGVPVSQIRLKLTELWRSVPKVEKIAWGKKLKRLISKTSPQKVGLMSSPAAILKSPLGSPQLDIKLNTGKAPESEPVYIASHLKLLGESLSIIGERLTEHEGQIAVSGSLSVLLDSLLCAMGPLMCLTQRVPELNGADPNLLAQTLDNVAYIMPGL